MHLSAKIFPKASNLAAKFKIHFSHNIMLEINPSFKK